MMEIKLINIIISMQLGDSLHLPEPSQKVSPDSKGLRSSLHLNLASISTQCSPSSVTLVDATSPSTTPRDKSRNLRKQLSQVNKQLFLDEVRAPERSVRLIPSKQHHSVQSAQKPPGASSVPIHWSFSVRSRLELAAYLFISVALTSNCISKHEKMD